MPQSLSVLVTNLRLSLLTGTVTFTRDLALGLLDAGHRPQIYTPNLGTVSAQLQELGVPVFDSLSKVAEHPDVIQGNQHAELVAAIAHFREVPAVFTCHGPLDLASQPPCLRRIKHYVAVDLTRRERLLREPWISADDVSVIGNSIDTKRFPFRKTPLPPSPGRALLVSNYATKSGFGGQLLDACRAVGLQLEIVGMAAQNVETNIGQRLAGVDVVFGVARSAIEAMAAGAVCILCDRDGIGPLVSPANVEHLRQYNFDRTMATVPITPESVAERLSLYDPENAALVQGYIRQEASLENMVIQYERLYRRIVGDRREMPEFADDFRQYVEHAGSLVAKLALRCGPEYTPLNIATLL